MKNNIFLGLAAILLLFSSCEEKVWVARDTELVPVYTLSGFEDDEPLKQDVYRTKDVMIEFTSDVQLLLFNMTDFVDSSTDTTYAFSYVLAMDQEIDNANDTIVQSLATRECFVNAVKDSINAGTISYIDHFTYDTISSTDNSIIGSVELIDTVYPPVSIELVEDEKYYVVE